MKTTKRIKLICKECPAVAPPGRRRCAKCTTRHNQRERERRAARRAAGTCPACGSKLKADRKHCSGCLAYWSERKAAAK